MAKRTAHGSPDLVKELVRAIYDDKPKKVASLIERGVDINASIPGLRGPATPFRLAADVKRDQIALMLLDAGAKLEEKDLNLVWAAGTKRADVVKRFIDLGADLNIKTGHGTPLGWAARLGYAEIVRILIEAGADVNADNSLGTPLQRAVEQDHTEAALLLIGAGASLDVTVGMGSLEKIARGNKNKVLADVLRRVPKVKKRIQHVAMLVGKPKTKKKAVMVTPPRRDPQTPDWVPDFTKRAKRREYAIAVADLEKRCGTPRQPMEHAAGGFTFHLHSAKARSFKLDRVQAEFLKRGAYVFTVDSLGRDTIAILPTTDKFEVMLAMYTSATNYDMGPQDIVAWMKELEKEQPYVLTGINWDFIEGKFLSKVKDPDKLAERMVDFCPDIGVAEGVAKALRKHNSLFFWWD